MAQTLYPGCDVWLNNPLRPLEACGTSGMKAALNGCLNLSVLDGWWDEWFDGAQRLGHPDRRRRRPTRTAATTSRPRRSTTCSRTPSRRCFYDRDADGPPDRWIEMVRHTLQTLGPKVLATRMVRDYVLGLYAPAADVVARRWTTATPAPVSSPPGRRGSARPGRRSGSTTSSPPASPTPPRWAARSRSGPS